MNICRRMDESSMDRHIQLDKHTSVHGSTHGPHTSSLHHSYTCRYANVAHEVAWRGGSFFYFFTDVQLDREDRADACEHQRGDSRGAAA